MWGPSRVGIKTLRAGFMNHENGWQACCDSRLLCSTFSFMLSLLCCVDVHSQGLQMRQVRETPGSPWRPDVCFASNSVVFLIALASVFKLYRFAMVILLILRLHSGYSSGVSQVRAELPNQQSVGSSSSSTQETGYIIMHAGKYAAENASMRWRKKDAEDVE